MPEDEQSKNSAMNLRLPFDLMNQIDQHAALHSGGNRSEVIRRAVESYLGQTGEQAARTPSPKKLAAFGYSKTILGPVEMNLVEDLKKSEQVACLVTEFDRWVHNHRHAIALRDRFVAGKNTFILYVPTGDNQPVIPSAVGEIFDTLDRDTILEGMRNHRFSIKFVPRVFGRFNKFIFVTENFCILSESVFGYPYAQVYHEQLHEDFNILAQTFSTITSLAVSSEEGGDETDVLRKYVETRWPPKRSWRLK
ncbi:CopG family transcriptional regulator [Rhizobium leguminosarum]|uniref:ribbon-helix-helix domain-containing protein n=1 Tax=Rhizobium leguminosarum TaxID=384 RepID=UPI00102F720B|nr:ribbon-helix-helix domain-containing protein [Rhizobium leguminosarum]TBG37176.1 CopG family transcriptional regulator [Rhizobium leguminosarum]